MAGVYINCVERRIQICKSVEGKCVREEVELDEVGERLDEEELGEQIMNVSVAGRCDLVKCLGGLNIELTRALGNLRGLFERGGEVGEEAAGVLEEVRVLILFVGWLITDETAGETPIIPEAIVEACASQQAQQIASTITQIVTSLSNLSSYQAMKISTESASPMYSPLIAQQLMWFFDRFCRVYLMPNPRLYDGLEQSILYKDNFGLEANAQALIDVCTKSAVLYITSWPSEVDVVEGAVKMLEGLCGGRIRGGLTRSEGWRNLCNVFWLVGATSIHTNLAFNPQELNAMGLTPAMVEGFKRLNYERRGDVGSVIACGSGGMPDDDSKNIMNKTLMLVEGTLTKLAAFISDPSFPNTNIEAVDLCSLCVSLFSGICRSPFVGIVDSAAEDSAEAYVLTKFITPSLPKLAALMSIYGPVDNSIKTELLTALTSYAELYISFLNPVESMALYNAASEMIKGYSAIGVGSSAKESDEEDQHEDVLQAIKLLTHLGTKDFIDVVDNSPGSTPTVDVTEVLFYGINHLLPLVSGLLEYPKIAHQFFDLVGYIVEAYPEKLNSLPPDFFESLIGSLLWGMSSNDVLVGKSCLRAIEEMTKEHVKNSTLSGILANKPDTLKLCVQRLLTDVVMAPSVVFDRIDVTGGALLVLIAADLNYFTTYVREMISRVGVQEQQQQLMAAFEQLVNLETIQTGIQGKGNVGRTARAAFKKTFGLFVGHVHSFLVVL
ncbi:hypothetical protein TrST_g29 [Triparma strigata]|uniref:Exportin-4 n=1 Tax=Triparma strigata TaxID=1606541 RepID=A0A9W7APB3_9STRA|nr:hypothetical protein TrST_g29 [Triparma strigata]